MKKKLIGRTAAIVAFLGVIALAAVEMARGGGMLLKFWAFISLVLVDIYVIIDILKEPPG